jgi:hypothetical protein
LTGRVWVVILRKKAAYRNTEKADEREVIGLGNEGVCNALGWNNLIWPITFEFCTDYGNGGPINVVLAREWEKVDIKRTRDPYF